MAQVKYDLNVLCNQLVGKNDSDGITKTYFNEREDKVVFEAEMFSMTPEILRILADAAESRKVVIECHHNLVNIAIS